MSWVMLSIGWSAPILPIVSFFTPLTSNNFHVIEPQQAYRSAQLSNSAFESYVKKHHIRTIINLRGIEKNKPWWRNEHALTHKLNLHFVNIPLLANRFPSPKQVKELLETFKLVPRPILIHCHHGRDRTGLAAALWVLEEMNLDKEMALTQLNYSPFGHMSWLFPGMRAFIEAWANLRNKQKSLPEAIKAYNPHRYGYEAS